VVLESPTRSVVPGSVHQTVVTARAVRIAGRFRSKEYFVSATWPLPIHEGRTAVARQQRKKRKGMSFEERPILEPNAGAVDVGARQMYVAVAPDRDENPVRVFETFTEDLNRLADWLMACGVTTVAMESTGVYWIPLYEILEQRGLKPCLVDARHMKNVPGRRTDWQECQWLQYLHSVGLLRAAFRPDEEVCAVRALMRHRKSLVEMAGQHVQHMQKALTQMNVQIHHVIDDLTGVTGLAIIDAVLGGQRNASELAKLRDRRIHADAETIRKSLVGHWRNEHLFTLKQSRRMYQIYQEQIQDCDREIEKLVGATPPRVDPKDKPLPPNQKRNLEKILQKNRTPGSEFNLRTESYKLFGVDLTQVPGLAQNILTLYSEIGRDMSRWVTAAHFTSWLSICPDNDISGGRVLWKGTRNFKNWAAQSFRLAAHGLHRSPTPLGDFLRRMKAKIGPMGAITATARKIAIIFYTMVKNQVEYDHTRWSEQNIERRKHIENRLRRTAKRIGFQLVPIENVST
jgi:transposase